MVNIDISEIYCAAIEPKLLEKTALAVLKLQNISPDVDISIVIVSDEEIQQLNAQYRGFDSPTDVLSFSSNEIDPETGRQYLGDIIISYPHALVQAEKANHPIANEIQLLIIHGVLHLLGYDHSGHADKQIMWEQQNRLLELLSIQINQLPEE